MDSPLCLNNDGITVNTYFFNQSVLCSAIVWWRQPAVSSELDCQVHLLMALLTLKMWFKLHHFLYTIQTERTNESKGYGLLKVFLSFFSFWRIIRNFSLWRWFWFWLLECKCLKYFLETSDVDILISVVLDFWDIEICLFVWFILTIL